MEKTRVLLDRALEMHLGWRVRLLQGLRVGDLPAPEQVADHSLCELGHWLAEARHKYGPDPFWQRLNQLHAEFHKQAAAVVGLINQGEADAAVNEIREGEYALAADRVVDALLRFQDRVEALALDAPLRKEPVDG